MGDLEKWFGPKEEPAEERLVQPTDWPRAEKPIRPILDKWQELEGGAKPGSEAVRKSWTYGARQWYAEVGGNVKLLEEAHRYMVGRGLDRKSPASALFYALRRKKPIEDGVTLCQFCYTYHADGECDV